MNITAQSNPTQGAQVVMRVAAVLRAVGQFSSAGVTTARVAELTALNRSTTHRLLTSLFTEGFIDHDVRLARWYPGPELFLLGSLAAARYDIADIARESVHTLAAQTGESAFLSARRGGETVCLIREEGSFPIRSFVLYEGLRSSRTSPTVRSIPTSRPHGCPVGSASPTHPLSYGCASLEHGKPATPSTPG
jgi:hypothetical protein